MWHWLKNAGDGSHFSEKDMVIRVLPQFHRAEPMGQCDFRDHVALWSEDGGDQAVRTSFQTDNERKFRYCRGRALLPLELFVMELFRVISPNGGSISTIHDARSGAQGAPTPQTFGVHS